MDASGLIERPMLAVTANTALNRQLTTPETVVARFPDLATANALDVFVFAYLHAPSMARAWIREAQRHTADSINRMTPRQQFLAVKGVWEAFGNFWKAANLSPYAWNPFRIVCEQAWAARYSVPSGNPDPGSPYWRGRVAWSSHWSGDTHYGDIRPGVWGGAWRDLALDSFRRYGGGTGSREDSLGPDQVIFGAIQSWNPDNLGCRPTDPSTPRNGCHAPTGETHRLWLQFDGTLNGGNLYGNLTTERGNVPGNLGVGFGELVGWPYNGLGCETLDWNCDNRNQQKPVHSHNQLWYIPPLRWYFELLRGPIQGLTVTPGGPAVSLVDYLAAQDVYAFAREVLLDVVTRNSVAQHVYGLTEAQLRTRGSDLYARSERERLSDIGQVTGITSAVSGLLNPFAAAGDGGRLVFGTAGAALAIVGGALNLVAQLVTPALTPAPERKIDVFGRLMPAYEVSVVNTSRTAYTAQLGTMGMPGGASGEPERAPGSPAPWAVEAPGGSGATPGTVLIRGLPRFTEVRIDGREIAYEAQPTGVWGGWANAAQTDYVLYGLTPGPHALETVAPDKTRRALTVSVGNAVAHGTMPRMAVGVLVGDAPPPPASPWRTDAEKAALRDAEMQRLYGEKPATPDAFGGPLPTPSTGAPSGTEAPPFPPGFGGSPGEPPPPAPIPSSGVSTGTVVTVGALGLAAYLGYKALSK